MKNILQLPCKIRNYGSFFAINKNQMNKKSYFSTDKKQKYYVQKIIVYSFMF